MGGAHSESRLVPGILGVPTGPTTTSITPERSTHISRAPHHVVRLASAHTRSGPSSARSRIQRMLPRTGRGSQLVLVWGWPTPIRMNARTESRPERESPFMVPPLATRPGGSFGRRGERDQLRLVHQDKSLPRDQGGAAAELLRVGADASLSEMRAKGAEARAGCAETAPPIRGRPRPGPPGRLVRRIA